MTYLFPDASEDFGLGWLVAFVDGEGTSVDSPRKTKKGYLRKSEIRPSLSISQNEKQIFCTIRDFFRCGTVRLSSVEDAKAGDENAKNLSYKYETRGLEDLLTIIIPFFEKHQPRVKVRKQAFERFVVLCRRMEKKEHLQEQGFKELSNLAREINNMQNPEKKRKPKAKKSSLDKESLSDQVKYRL